MISPNIDFIGFPLQTSQAAQAENREVGPFWRVPAGRARNLCRIVVFVQHGNFIVSEQ
jgi:hypothetical protein